MAEQPTNALRFPEVTWKHYVIWRGEGTTTDSVEASRAAKDMSSRLAPTVTDEGEPALAVMGTGTAGRLFVIDWPHFEWPRHLSPIQRAAKIVAEMTWGDAPEIVWEAVVVSGDHVLWTPSAGWPEYEALDRALEQATEVLLDRLRPAACEHYPREEGWDSCIDYLHQSGSIDVRRIRTDSAWATKAEAWRHASRVLAEAEATVRQAPDRKPIVIWPGPTEPTQAAGLAA